MIKRLVVSLLVCLFALAWAQSSIEVRVAQSSDDAEEFPQESSLGPAGTVFLDSSDLELLQDNAISQVVGLRFTDVALPQGATVTNAYVQFTVDEMTDTPTEITLQGEVSDNAETFSDTEASISSRPLTAASVTWSPAPWSQEGASGAEQQTTDLTSVVQEIVDQPGWQSGNALAIIMAGSGERTAESFDGSQGNAPLLYVEYQEAGTSAEEPETGGAETAQVDAETGGAETEMESAETGGAQETAQPTEEPAETTEEAEEPDETEMTEEEPSTQTETVEPAPSTPVPSLSNSGLIEEQRYALESAGDSAVNGTLLVGDYNTGSLVMTVILNRQPADATYAAELYRGNCGDGAAADRLISLDPVEGARGSISATTLPLTFASLAEANLYLNVYDSPDNTGTVVACGEVGTQ